MSTTTTIRKTYTGEHRVGLPRISLKASDEGKVVAVVSVFGNTDRQGDRVVRGAFARSLERWAASGRKIPMIVSHEWSNLDAHVGSWDPALARETSEGLELTGRFDLSDDAGRKAHRLVRDGLIVEWSFAYDVKDERRAEDGANELLELDIIEAGPTLKGANPETRTVSVKSRGPSCGCADCTVEDLKRSLLAGGREAADDVDATVAELKGVLARGGKSSSPAAAPDSKPSHWEIVARAGRFCVRDTETGENEACFDNRQSAERLLAALERREGSSVQALREQTEARFGPELTELVFGPSKSARAAAAARDAEREAADQAVRAGVGVGSPGRVLVDARMRIIEDRAPATPAPTAAEEFRLPVMATDTVRPS